MAIRYNSVLPYRDNLALLVDAENAKSYRSASSIVKNLANTFDDGVSDAANEFPSYTARSGSVPAYISFDGEIEANGGDHLAFPEELRNGRGNQITLVALIRPTTTILPEAVIFCPSPGTSGGTGFRFLLSSYGSLSGFNSSGTQWCFRFASFGIEFVETYSNTDGDLNTDEWYFLAVTAESSNTDVKMFRNGNFVEVVDASTGTAPLNAVPVDWGATGEAWRVADGLGGAQRHGGFDLNFLGIWDTRFTDSEIILLWEQLRGRVGL